MTDVSASTALAGRVGIVTGASRGLGRAIADRFAQAGASVLVLDLKPAWAEASADAITESGGIAVGRACDVSDRDQVHAAVEFALAEFGRLDVLVNNAMWNRYEQVADIQPETAARMLGVGFNGVVWGIQAAAPAMRATGGGAIVNIGSVSGQLGLPNALVYCGIKAAVAGLTRAAATELGPDGIRVNAIAPSTVATEGVLAMMGEETFARRVASTPLRRLGETSDIAEAALYLASDSAAFVTGQVLTVDGGIATSLT